MKSKLLLRISAIISGASGFIILIAVGYPIFFYNSFASNGYSDLISPVTKNVQSARKEEVDYTKASNWFAGDEDKEGFVSSSVTFYNLSIPKLKIENATVAIGGEDLAQSLIQYPGTALPGKLGNSVIFGHSILPIFYNPKDYMSIFSTLPTLKKGDEIKIDYDGVSYEYEVYDLFEVKPTDLQVLQQDKGDSYLTLVTCIPPGDPRKPKRLIVRARVIPPENLSNESIYNNL